MSQVIAVIVVVATCMSFTVSLGGETTITYSLDSANFVGDGELVDDVVVVDI